MAGLKREQFLEVVAYVERIRFELIGIHVLMGKGEFRAEENDKPAELQPYQKKRQGGETSIDGVIFCSPDLEDDIAPLNKLV